MQHGQRESTGLGWLFISQTLSSLHQEILQQLRIFFLRIWGLGLDKNSIRFGDSLVPQVQRSIFTSFSETHIQRLTLQVANILLWTIGPCQSLYLFSGSPAIS